MTLATLRTARGLSQAAAGQLIGKTQSHWAKIEAGKVRLSAADALTLCTAWKVDLSQLLTSGTESLKK